MISRRLSCYITLQKPVLNTDYIHFVIFYLEIYLEFRDSFYYLLINFYQI